MTASDGGVSLGDAYDSNADQRAFMFEHPDQFQKRYLDKVLVITTTQGAFLLPLLVIPDDNSRNIVLQTIIDYKTAGFMKEIVDLVGPTSLESYNPLSRCLLVVFSGHRTISCHLLVEVLVDAFYNPAFDDDSV